MASTLREELVTKATQVKMLPSLQPVVGKVFGVLGDKNSSFEQLAAVAKYDQAISSKLISIANSAYYSRGTKVLNLQRAMLVMGFEEIKRIVTCLVFLDGILKRMSLRRHDFTALWRHSLYVASAAEVLSTKSLREDPENVFAVALLHDIGKIILYMNNIGYRDSLTNGEPESQCLKERELFGIDHEEIGSLMAIKWRLPEEFAQTISHHHNSGGEGTALMRFVTVADLFALNSDRDLGPEGFILEREKGMIEKDIDGIMDVLGF